MKTCVLFASACTFLVACPICVSAESPHEAKAVPGLIKALKDKKPSVRRRAAKQLQELGPLARPALTPLVEALMDEEEEVRMEASYTLGAMGSVAVPLLTQALSYTKEGRLHASCALRQIGPSAKAAVPRLIRVANDDEYWIVRAAATDALGHIGDRRALSALMHLIRTDCESRVREAAASALGRFAPEETKVVPILIEALDANERVRWQAADSLASCGSKAVPLLVAYIRNRKSKHRAIAVGILQQMRKEGKAAIPTLVEALNESNEQVRLASVSALGAMGCAAKDSIPVLKHALNDNSGLVRVEAGRAMFLIFADNVDGVSAGDSALIKATVIPVLARALKDKDEAVRSLAANVFNNDFGDLAASAIPALIESLRDPCVCVEVIYALNKMGSLAKPAIPVLKELASGKDEFIAIQAKIAIKQISYEP
jgi:HEAT repeat protein